jgi:centromere protein C
VKSPLANGTKTKSQGASYNDFSEPDDSVQMVDGGAPTYLNEDQGDDPNAAGDDDLLYRQIKTIDPALLHAPVEESSEDSIAGAGDDTATIEESYEKFAEGETVDEVVGQSQPKAQRKRGKKALFTTKSKGQTRKIVDAEPESLPKTRGKSGVSLAFEDENVQPTKRSRKANSQQTAVYQDPEEDSRPTKKAKRGPAPKDANAKMSVRHPKEIEELIERVRSRPRRPHNLFILRRETPADDSVLHTRSGRLSVRPLAYWKNERCVYGDGEAEEGERFPLATIKEVIRTEEVEADLPSRRRKKSKGRKRQLREESEDEDDEEMDDWEREPGIMNGDILRWDPQAQEAIDITENLGICLF